MRISTSTIYSDNISTMNTLQAQIAQTQQQISTGRRILNPADDPSAAARAVEIGQSEAMNTQYADNRTSAINTLSLSEGILQNVTSLLQDARLVALDAGNGLLTDSSRKSMAQDLQGRLNELLGLANSTDGKGSYLFSGAQGKVKPFVDTVAGVTYQGDDMQRKVQASAARQISSTDAGSDIFMRIRNGNGVFHAERDAANTGNAIITQGSLVDSSLYNGESYRVVFTSATTYDINDVTAGLPGTNVTSGTYADGQAITVNGIQFEIKGTPANGDIFDITPSANQSLFTTLDNLIATLNGSIPSTNAMNSAAYRQGLNEALASLDQGLNSVLGVRATMGSRLNELDALQITGDELGLQFKQTLSKLQDTDYNKAISELTMQNLMLQASQQSFAKVSQMSLFNYI
ncbi:MAG: flagellar hook-associated protein FlgL [Gammaproteobacteria bacterium]|nr:flagellar hook-associated protein FlgL [Gammaproteobacteria bacterium]MBU1776354.1 flagellar hook-associated protein FlgL [Gammaproteobacteria bacterium]MBU1968206.1 flagellar hook-associated protein FlgL [Gammaproteobacteria bacterium]